VSWLSRAGFTVLEAEIGGEALARVGVDQIDLVVLDVRLPDLEVRGLPSGSRPRTRPCR
jgi:CheY-like chemotaxis protein